MCNSTHDPVQSRGIVSTLFLFLTSLQIMVLRLRPFLVQFPLFKESARVSHRKGEEQSFLTHQMTHGVVPKHARAERKSSRSCLDGRRRGYVSICRCKVRCRNEGECDLHGAEDPDIDQVAVTAQPRRRSKNSETVSLTLGRIRAGRTG